MVKQTKWNYVFPPFYELTMLYLMQFCFLSHDIFSHFLLSAKWLRQSFFFIDEFLQYVIHLNLWISETWTSHAIIIQENYTQQYTYTSCATCIYTNTNAHIWKSINFSRRVQKIEGEFFSTRNVGHFGRRTCTVFQLVCTWNSVIVTNWTSLFFSSNKNTHYKL